MCSFGNGRDAAVAGADHIDRPCLLELDAERPSIDAPSAAAVDGADIVFTHAPMARGTCGSSAEGGRFSTSMIDLSYMALRRVSKGIAGIARHIPGDARGSANRPDRGRSPDLRLPWVRTGPGFFLAQRRKTSVSAPTILFQPAKRGPSTLADAGFLEVVELFDELLAAEVARQAGEPTTRLGRRSALIGARRNRLAPSMRASSLATRAAVP